MATRHALPQSAYHLGYAGLLPQAGAVALLASGSQDFRSTALALATAYAALILSFLGGLWWGLGASDPEDMPTWIWPVGVAPSLIALAACIPSTSGATEPSTSLWLLGLALIATPLVDRKLDDMRLAPAGWLGLRRRLSVGLALLTVAAAML